QRPDGLEPPDRLVTGNEREPATQLPGVLLMIGSAQTARRHADEPVVIANVGDRQLPDRKPARRLQHQRPRRPAVAHQPAEPAVLNSSNSSSPRVISAAATFSSRCATLDVPGIGNITGDRFSNHASASCDGVAWWLAAMRCRGPSVAASGPAANGNQGTNPMFWASHASRTGSDVRTDRLYMFCTETIGAIFSAACSWSTLTSESPIWRILPSRCSAASSPTWSSAGNFESIRCNWNRSIRSTP